MTVVLAGVSKDRRKAFIAADDLTSGGDQWCKLVSFKTGMVAAAYGSALALTALQLCAQADLAPARAMDLAVEVRRHVGAMSSAYFAGFKAKHGEPLVDDILHHNMTVVIVEPHALAVVQVFLGGAVPPIILDERDLVVQRCPPDALLQFGAAAAGEPRPRMGGLDPAVFHDTAGRLRMELASIADRSPPDRGWADTGRSGHYAVVPSTLKGHAKIRPI